MVYDQRHFVSERLNMKLNESGKAKNRKTDLLAAGVRQAPGTSSLELTNERMNE